MVTQYCTETTFDIPVKGGTVRLWLKYQENTIVDVSSQVRAVIAALPEADIKEIAEAIAAKIPNIHAVQVQVNENELKLGHMIYTVPFSEEFQE